MRTLVLSLMVAGGALASVPLAAAPSSALAASDRARSHVTEEAWPNGWMIRSFVYEESQLDDAEYFLQLRAAQLMAEQGATHYILANRLPVNIISNADAERLQTNRQPSCGSRGRGSQSSCEAWGRAGQRRTGWEERMERRGNGVAAYFMPVAPDHPGALPVAETLARLEAQRDG